MKKFLFLLLLGLSFFGFRAVKQNVKEDLAKPVTLPSIKPSPTEVLRQVKGMKVSRSVFVSYWSLGEGELEDTDYNQFLYFGITPSNSGINKKEAGFINIDKFINNTPKGASRQLVVRMIDSNITFPILKDSTKQNSVIKDSINIAKENGFKGIVLDLEISAVPFESLIKQINSFTKEFYSESKKNDLEFSLMFYGDSFYRLRPFDIKELSKNGDNFLIMAYDFSKSRSNPGPNFPLRGKEVYGYDMTRMTEDFLRFLPPEKTSIVFGLFGYDWIVDDKGTALSQGEAKTYQEIKKEFLSGCNYKDCDIKRKNDSVETEIKYTDEGKKHIVWFEDMESVKKKQDYLKTKGISNFSFWAYSYF